MAQQYVAAFLFSFLAGSVFAQGVTPRFAEPVRPRTATAVEPRNATAVEPRAAAPVINTAVAGKASEWHWQALGDTPVGQAAFGKGLQLKDVRCAGVTCRVYESDPKNATGSGWMIQVKGGFPDAGGSTAITSKLIDMDTRKAVEIAATGNMSDGSFSKVISTETLANGNYVMAYQRAGTGRTLAAVMFSVVHHADSRTTPATGYARYLYQGMSYSVDEKGTVWGCCGIGPNMCNMAPCNGISEKALKKEGQRIE